jgi:general secretion pathway protein F
MTTRGSIQTQSSAAFLEIEAAPRLSARDLELLFGQLANMVNAGLMLERALKAIEQSAMGSPRALVANQLVTRMRQGLSPARAFGEDTTNFDSSIISLVRSSELTGDIGPVLAEIERLLAARNQLRTKIQTALIYPAILSLVALGSVLTILLVVIPQFSGLVRTHMDQLPTAARAVFWLSDTVRELAWPLLGIISLVVLLIVRGVRSHGLAPIAMSIVKAFPGGKAVSAKVETAAFLRLLGTLLSRNVRLMPAIDVASQAIADGRLAQAIDTMRGRLKSGASLANALAETDQFPPITVQLARVGEETGNLGAMLTRSAAMLEEDVERLSKLFIIWFEPMLLAGIGTLIGGLLYGLFSAILSINTLV